MRIVFRPRWHRGAVKGSLHSRIEGHIALWRRIRQVLSRCRRGPHFGPSAPTLFLRLTAFFTCSVSGTARNFCSQAGLVLQPLATDIAALISNRTWKMEVRVMLSWVVTFLIIALIAGILGFGGMAGASIEIAKIIFFIAVVLFLVSAVVGLARGRTRV